MHACGGNLLMALALSVVSACGARPADEAVVSSPSEAGAASVASTGALTVRNETPTPRAENGTGTAAWATIGISVQGRPIRALTIGHGPRKVLFVNGVHGDEPEAIETTAQLPGAFTAGRLSDAVTLTIVEDANPDGRAAGSRYNANGVDVNRNFPASNFNTTDPSYGGKPLTEPESRALYDIIERTQPSLVLSTHSWLDGEFVNFDGPAAALAERFARSSGLPVRQSNSFDPTPGSLGSYIGRDRGIPILTIEVRKGSAPQQVWDQLRAALLEAIRG